MAKCKACGVCVKKALITLVYGKPVCPVCKRYIDLSVTIAKRTDREESRCLK